MVLCEPGLVIETQAALTMSGSEQTYRAAQCSCQKRELCIQLKLMRLYFNRKLSMSDCFCLHLLFCMALWRAIKSYEYKLF